VPVAAATIATQLPAGAHGIPSIKNPQTNKCMQPIGGSMDAGAPVVLEPCSTSPDGIPEQDWFPQAIDFTGTRFHLINSKSGMCLDVLGSNTNGTPVGQWPCNSNSDERWIEVGRFLDFDHPAPIYSNISGSLHTCLEAPDDPTAAVRIAACANTPAQQWLPIG
jgi:hypothetical protein